MVDGQVRRTLRRKRKSAGDSEEPTQRLAGSVTHESGTISDDDSHAIGDDTNAVIEPVSTKRVGVGIIEVDPNELDSFIARDTAGTGTGTDSDSGSGGRTKQRRKRRTTNNKETPANLEAVATMLHTLAATVLHTPELILAPEESKQLSDAYATFCEHHEVPMLTAKRMSEVQLISTAFMIYGTRLVAVRNRKRAERAEASGNVTAMPQRANVTH